MSEFEGSFEPELHSPTIIQQGLEKVGLREVVPSDLVKDQKNLDLLLRRYPDLAGDPNFGLGNDGGCPSYTDHKGWWKDLVQKRSV